MPLTTLPDEDTAYPVAAPPPIQESRNFLTRMREHFLGITTQGVNRVWGWNSGGTGGEEKNSGKTIDLAGVTVLQGVLRSTRYERSAPTLSGGSVAANFENGNCIDITLTQDVVSGGIGAITNLDSAAISVGLLRLRQDGTGGRQIAGGFDVADGLAAGFKLVVPTTMPSVANTGVTFTWIRWTSSESIELYPWPAST